MGMAVLECLPMWKSGGSSTASTDPRAEIFEAPHLQVATGTPGQVWPAASSQSGPQRRFDHLFSTIRPLIYHHVDPCIVLYTPTGTSP